jgi:hypothetical protein
LFVSLSYLLVPILVSGQGGVTIDNPLNVDTFTDLICLIIGFLIQISFPIGAIMIIVGGFYFVTAAEDPAKIETGKKIILWTLIGLIIVFSAYGIIRMFGEALGIEGGTCSGANQIDFMQVLDNIANWLWAILMAVAAIFIIVAGFHFVTAQGDPEKINLAKRFLLYALIGALVGSLARALVMLVSRIVSDS